MARSWEEALEAHVRDNEHEFQGIERAFDETKALISSQIARVRSDISALAVRVDRIEATMSSRFDGIYGRFETIDQRFETIDQRFETIDQRFETIDQRFETIDQRFDAMDQRFDTIERRFDRLDGQIDLIVKAIVRP